MRSHVPGPQDTYQWTHGSQGGSGERCPQARGEFEQRQMDRASSRQDRSGGEDWRSGGWGFGSGPGSTSSETGDWSPREISRGPGGGHGEQWDAQSHGSERSQWWYQGGTFV